MARRKRKYVPLKVKLAAALLALGHIDYEESKAMTAGQVISRYDFDHWPILHALGGQDVPWNLRPLLKAKHRDKSGKDTTAVAKVKRLILKQACPAPIAVTRALFQDARASDARLQNTRHGRPIASRGFPKRDRCWKATPPRDVNHE